MKTNYPCTEPSCPICEIIRDMRARMDELTWKPDGNAVEYRLNGVLIERVLASKSEYRWSADVIRAIRRYAPRFNSYKTAHDLWRNQRREA